MGGFRESDLGFRLWVSGLGFTRLWVLVSSNGCVECQRMLQFDRAIKGYINPIRSSHRDPKGGGGVRGLYFLKQAVLSPY